MRSCDFAGNTQDSCPWYEFKNYWFKITSHLPGANELTLNVITTVDAAIVLKSAQALYVFDGIFFGIET